MAQKVDEPNAAILAELRCMNRLLAAFTTRGVPRAEAITLLGVAGFGPGQIADLLGINPSTVRTTLHRARKAATAAGGRPDGDVGGTDVGGERDEG